MATYFRPLMRNSSGWQSVPLDTAPFDPDAMYRVKMINSDNQPADGWVYPTMITSDLLFMTVSTAQFAFGAITKDQKGRWEYRKWVIAPISQLTIRVRAGGGRSDPEAGFSIAIYRALSFISRDGCNFRAAMIGGRRHTLCPHRF